MIDIFDFNAIAGSLTLDARVAVTFRGALSGNLAIGFSNVAENQETYVKVAPNGFAITFGSVTFPTGTTFSTSSDSVVRVTKVSGALYGELLNP